MPTLEESFCAAEERALRFLVDDYGFRSVARSVIPGGPNWSGMFVRYRSQGLPGGAPEGWSVSLAYTPVRLELSLDISDERGDHFGVEELHALVSSSSFPRGIHSLFCSSESEGAQFDEFTLLAGVLKQAGARFFTGDRSLWRDLRMRREHAWQADEDRRAIARSEVAFKAKKWHQVVAALESRGDRLSKATAARLAYARKKLQSAA